MYPGRMPLQRCVESSKAWHVASERLSPDCREGIMTPGGGPNRKFRSLRFIGQRAYTPAALVLRVNRGYVSPARCYRSGRQLPGE